MAKRFFAEGMTEFKDYYPVEDCGDKEGFRCECGHLEERVELIYYDEGWVFDSMKIKCEKCGKETRRSL